MAQQVQISTSQTVKPVRQPRGPPSTLKTEKDGDDSNSNDYNEENNKCEFSGINDLAIKTLGWKADKPSNFTIKGNFKHITDSLRWYIDVPIILKDKENKTVTVIGNFVHIDNSETELMLFLERLKKKYEELEKRLIKTEEMLYLVLNTVRRDMDDTSDTTSKIYSILSKIHTLKDLDNSNKLGDTPANYYPSS
ncbi:hypothetical protein C1645_742694 [Glomus cerebriforme]|uniref:Uncharacterized protein n=1 Tax=Glomus cerebriforme TaxID=658196 RepID=A0A397SJ11_9GLOM|nr:hypothetical protein C1645_742694 [Glomus cerebriforme]